MDRKKAEQVFYELFDRNCGRWNGIARCYAAPAERDVKLPRDTIDDLATLAESQSGTADSEQRILDQFVATLSDSERAVLLLFMDDMPQDAPAKILGISPGTYRVRVHRLKKKFEETFQLNWSPPHESK